MYERACIHVLACKCVISWRPQLDLRKLSQYLFYLILWDKVFQLNPQIIDLATLPSQGNLKISHISNF